MYGLLYYLDLYGRYNAKMGETETKCYIAAEINDLDPQFLPSHMKYNI